MSFSSAPTSIHPSTSKSAETSSSHELSELEAEHLDFLRQSLAKKNALLASARTFSEKRRKDPVIVEYKARQDQVDRLGNAIEGSRLIQSCVDFGIKEMNEKVITLGSLLERSEQKKPIDQGTQKQILDTFATSLSFFKERLNNFKQVVYKEQDEPSTKQGQLEQATHDISSEPEIMIKVRAESRDVSEKFKAEIECIKKYNPSKFPEEVQKAEIIIDRKAKKAASELNGSIRQAKLTESSIIIHLQAIHAHAKNGKLDMKTLKRMEITINACSHLNNELKKEYHRLTTGEAA